MTPQQQIFDHTYVNSAEICRRCEIDLSTLTAWRIRHKFPEPPIVVGQRTRLWVRAEIEYVINRINLERRSKG